MAFTSFTAGNLIKSSEVNANYGEILKTSIDNALLNTTSIDVMDLIDSPFKIVDLFTDSTGNNNTVDGNYNSVFDTTNFYFYNFEANNNIINNDFEDWTGLVLDDWVMTVGTYGSITKNFSYRNKTFGVYLLEDKYSDSDWNGTDLSHITQIIDFTGFDNLSLFYAYTISHHYSGNGNGRVRIYIDTDVVFEENFSQLTSGAVSESKGWTKLNLDVTSYTGNHTLKFESYITSSGSSGPKSQFYVDYVCLNNGEFINSYIQSSSQSVGTGYNYALVRPKLYEAIPSGADITCNISLDGGSTFSSESNINEIIDVSGLTDTGNLVVKMNLNTDGTSTSKVSGWACVLF